VEGVNRAEAQHPHSGVRLVLNSDQADQVLAAPRALLYFSVDWSVPERESRRVFLDVVSILQIEGLETGIGCFSVQEDTEIGHKLLSLLGRARDFDRGNGELYWLSSGQIVGECPFVARELPATFVSKTRELWNTKPSFPQ
jgi:hypothetical protein